MNSFDWSALTIDENDLDFIYNLLLEKETPMTPLQLAVFLIGNRIESLSKEKESEQDGNDLFYRPKTDYQVGDAILFPRNGGATGTVTAVREGKNPALAPFRVVTVAFEDGSTKEYASGLADHLLNDYDYTHSDNSWLDEAYVEKKYGLQIAHKIASVLAENKDLVKIAGFWFPQALLSEVNPGYLNLTEAVLEMVEGEPLPTKEILEQIEYPMDSNSELTEFSFNYALQQDDRFAEVGPTGIVLWTLKEMQPEDVRKVPMTLKFDVSLQDYRMDFEADDFAVSMHDELDPEQLEEPAEIEDSFEICVSYPHWKAGTLPLIGAVRQIFPTALETDNVTFHFRNKKTGDTFPGWVIISKNYVCGLKQWYRANGIIPGSIFKISKTEDAGVIDIQLIPPRASKDWIRTFSVDAKNRFSFITNQHKVTTKFDERQAIYVENSPQLDTFWETHNRQNVNIKKQIELVFQELAKDNPQGIIHFHEVYAGMNMLRRVPPRVLYAILLNDKSIQQIDQMYFKMKENEEAES